MCFYIGAVLGEKQRLGTAYLECIQIVVNEPYIYNILILNCGSVFRTKIVSRRQNRLLCCASSDLNYCIRPEISWRSAAHDLLPIYCASVPVKSNGELFLYRLIVSLFRRVCNLVWLINLGRAICFRGLGNGFTKIQWEISSNSARMPTKSENLLTQKNGYILRKKFSKLVFD